MARKTSYGPQGLIEAGSLLDQILLEDTLRLSIWATVAGLSGLIVTTAFFYLLGL